jgi:hypothetical protein
LRHENHGETCSREDRRCGKVDHSAQGVDCRRFSAISSLWRTLWRFDWMTAASVEISLGELIFHRIHKVSTEVIVEKIGKSI